MARKKSSVWKILLLVVGIPLAIVLGLLGCSLLYELTAKEVPAGDAERAIVPTAAYVAGWMEPEFQPDANAETLTKKRYFDGRTTWGTPRMLATSGPFSWLSRSG